jgi:hypothetical protein
MRPFEISAPRDPISPTSATLRKVTGNGFDVKCLIHSRNDFLLYLDRAVERKQNPYPFGLLVSLCLGLDGRNVMLHNHFSIEPRLEECGDLRLLYYVP